MNEIHAHCSIEQAQRLQAIGAVRASVLGRLAIVVANAWQPVTPDPSSPAHYVKAREVQNLSSDVEAKGTPEAAQETQQLIDALTWEAWPS